MSKFHLVANTAVNSYTTYCISSWVTFCTLSPRGAHHRGWTGRRSRRTRCRSLGRSPGNPATAGGWSASARNPPGRRTSAARNRTLLSLSVRSSPRVRCRQVSEWPLLVPRSPQGTPSWQLECGARPHWAPDGHTEPISAPQGWSSPVALPRPSYLIISTDHHNSTVWESIY